MGYLLKWRKLDIQLCCWINFSQFIQPETDRSCCGGCDGSGSSSGYSCSSSSSLFSELWFTFNFQNENLPLLFAVVVLIARRRRTLSSCMFRGHRWKWERRLLAAMVGRRETTTSLSSSRRSNKYKRARNWISCVLYLLTYLIYLYCCLPLVTLALTQVANKKEILNFWLCLILAPVAVVDPTLTFCPSSSPSSSSPASSHSLNTSFSYIHLSSILNELLLF